MVALLVDLPSFSWQAHVPPGQLKIPVHMKHRTEHTILTPNQEETIQYVFRTYSSNLLSASELAAKSFIAISSRSVFVSSCSRCL